MSLDILGPADAANAVTTRPSDGRTFGIPDSWFKDCTAIDIDDGTEFRADFFNGLLAVLRNMWRVNGIKGDGTGPVVAEVGSDDYGLAKSMQHLIQRGQPQFAIDTGIANAMVVTLAPAPSEYKAGMVIRPRVAFDITGPTTINANGLGFVSVTRPDGRPLLKGDIVKGMIPELVFDGAAFQLMGGRVNTLSAPLDYYVNDATGNDGFPGTISQPFKTIQAAINAANAFDPNNFTITVHVADAAGYGSFTSGAGSLTGFGTIKIVGNTATPANVVISSNTGPCATFTGKARNYILAGVKLVASAASPNGTGILAQDTNVSYYNVDFGYCSTYHVWASRAAVTLMGANDGVSGAFVNISGAAGVAHMRASEGGLIGSHCPALNVTAAVAVGTFAVCDLLSEISFVGGANFYSSISGYGNVTSGVRYQVSGNSIINTNGSGESYFPGTSAGIKSTGGQYI